MPFQKGHTKTGGKVIGSKHKITRDVAKLLDELGCNPLEGLATIANDPAAPVAVRSKCFADLAKYVHPQLQSVQHSGPDGGPIRTQHVSSVDALESELARISARENAPGDLPPDGGSAS
jgi:hypothetical protein